MRLASIHTTEEKLFSIISDFEDKGMIVVQLRGGKKALVKRLMKEASKKQLTSRKLEVSNAKTKKKATSIIMSDKESAQLFAKLLVMCRRNLKHRGISLIKEGTKDWLYIKEAAALANDFCKEYNLEPSDGYTKYIRIAIKKMSKFSVNKFNSLNQLIFDTYQAMEIINSDPYSDLTERAYQTYCNIMFESVGWNTDYTDMPDKYVYFCSVSENCLKLNVEPEIYIKAQFEAFAYKNGVPDPTQLANAKAEERLSKYLFENQDTIKREIDTTDNNHVNILKNLKDLE